MITHTYHKKYRY